MSRYLGQCDRLRRCGPDHERNWRRMMAKARPVPLRTFLRHVDLAPLLDDGETPQEYLRLALRDPGGGLFTSVWGSQRAWFLATAGFEFIFVD